MNASPFSYPDPEGLPADLRERATRPGAFNIVRMMMHTPGLAPGFLAMAGDMLQHNSLPHDWRELAILRVGHTYRAGYEVHHHNRIGRAVGLSEAELEAVTGDPVEGLTPQQVTIVHLTDLLLAQHTLTDTQRDEALQVLTVNQLADLVLTVGFYQMVSNFLNTFGVTPDGEEAAQ
ncbi:MAG: carboxymuconolactone decarboxylase family protein [Mycobacterium sp.]|uniref:carboxymuconolactone decarboxylase family protein n=1 Tax=Mycobacterium sp. TaxID=1785 RepID=UPI001ECC1AD5|nr:carboxymuconolactone decarboxylase family protein [Mycobacterium sp.]MBW0019909.1 carboxymuconolactone decarboxylase family protein [Mycobacterium sp.]